MCFPRQLTKKYQRKTAIFQSDALCPSKINNLNLIIGVFTKIIYDWRDIASHSSPRRYSSVSVHVSVFLSGTIDYLSGNTSTVCYLLCISSLILFNWLRSQAQSMLVSNKQRAKFFLSEEHLGCLVWVFCLVLLLFFHVCCFIFVGFVGYFSTENKTVSRE